MIGLGRMGAAMALRLKNGGHRVVGFDGDTAARAHAEQTASLEAATSLADLISRLYPPRVVWMMVPAGDVVDDLIAELRPLMARDDTLVDGGNSNYKDTMRRAEALTDCGIHYIDCGTSGGIWGSTEGYCLMIGGPMAAVEGLRPLFETLAPGADRGWMRVGPTGAGHFTKMVHNGIEYGLMQAYAEGFSILRHKEEFALDLHGIAEIWRHGSVVRSWLLDLTSAALKDNPSLAGVAPYVADSGEGRWTVSEAIDLDVPAPVITLSLLARLRSREESSFSAKLLAALRHQFGGHAVREEP